MSRCNQKKESCQKPENLKGNPEDCSLAQIKECHGDAKAHPCVTKTSDERQARH